MYTKDPCEGEAYVCAAIPTKDRKPVILKRTERSFWGGHPGHFAADEAVILNRTARSYWSGLRKCAHKGFCEHVLKISQKPGIDWFQAIG